MLSSHPSVSGANTSNRRKFANNYCIELSCLINNILQEFRKFSFARGSDSDKFKN